jgi:hypothetical protein
MKPLLLIAFIGIATTTQAQWHSTKERLTEPSSLYQASIRYFDRYDTVPCLYTLSDTTHPKKGYKKVFVKNGYYTDNGLTEGILFNSRMKRIYNATKYRITN